MPAFKVHINMTNAMTIHSCVLCGNG